jgi:hypothetical protein
VQQPGGGENTGAIVLQCSVFITRDSLVERVRWRDEAES